MRAACAFQIIATEAISGRARNQLNGIQEIIGSGRLAHVEQPDKTIREKGLGNNFSLQDFCSAHFGFHNSYPKGNRYAFDKSLVLVV